MKSERDALSEDTSLFYMGQIYYSFLLTGESNKRLTLEAISDREVTSELLQANASWALQTLSFIQQNPRTQETFMPAHIVAAGGVYDYIYYALKNNVPLDPEFVLRLNIKAFLSLSARKNETPQSISFKHRIDSSTMDSILEQIRAALLSYL